MRMIDTWYDCYAYSSTAEGVVNSTNGGCATTPGENYKWMDAIQPYVKSIQIFNCPSRSRMPSATTNDLQYRYRAYTSSGQYAGGYGLNNAYSSSTTDNFNGPAGQPLAVIAAPATTILAADVLIKSYSFVHQTYEFGWGSPSAEGIVTDSNSMTGRRLHRIEDRHLETTNVLYCDGHVKAVKLDALAEKKTVNGTANIATAFTVEDD